MAKPRKIQLQSAHLKVGNFKGTFTNVSGFTNDDALANDLWLYAGVEDETLGIRIRPGDLIMKTNDDEYAFTEANIEAGHWKLIRNITEEEIDWLSQQMYTPPTASLSGGATLEKYHSLLPYGTTLTWSVQAGTNPIATIELQKREGAGIWTKVKDLTGTSGSETVSVTINTDTQYRILVSSKSGEAVYSAIRSVTFQYKTGYRVDVAAPAIDDTWLKTGSMSFDTDAYRNFTADAAAGEHIYYYVPKALVSSPFIEPPYFYVGGFEGGFAVFDTEASYEFGDGTTGDYVVYRSTQAGLGNTNVTVQNS